MERVSIRLREDITFGKFNPGEHLSEKFLAQAYGVSRVTMREVIKQLATQGYLTVEKNRGATVTKLSKEDVDVIYNILMRCESYASRLFADRRDTLINRKLKILCEKMRAKSYGGRSRVWYEKNEDFHKLIYTNCGSAILSNLVFHTRLRIYRYRMLTTEPSAIDFFQKQHRRILSAILKGDGRLAEKYMAEHVDAARKQRFEALREVGYLL
jgi:DNA-binding GntR family transcriptional regulator